jgi:hypothetical protein
LQVVVVAPPDLARRAARERARTAAIVAGRRALVDEATAAARDLAMRAFARSGFSGTWAATDMAVSVVRASDRVATAAALEDAAIAAVVEDLVDEDTLDVLRSAWESFVSLREIPSPGSLATFAAPMANMARGPIQALIVVAFVGFLVVGAFSIGSVSGMILVAGAIAIVVGLTRRRSQPDP